MLPFILTFQKHHPCHQTPDPSEENEKTFFDKEIVFSEICGQHEQRQPLGLMRLSPMILFNAVSHLGGDPLKKSRMLQRGTNVNTIGEDKIYSPSHLNG